MYLRCEVHKNGIFINKIIETNTITTENPINDKKHQKLSLVLSEC